VIVVLLAAAAGVSGCASGGASHVQRWAESRGGTLAAGPEHDRAQAALAPLIACGAIQRPLTVAVLDCDDTGAYCWRSGAVYVTRGLLDRLDDDEVTAAIAHEVGHLLVDGHMPRTAALDGCRSACGAGAQEDSEIAADLLGRELLKMSGVSERALTRLLSKLAANPANTINCRDHLARRIAALDAPRASGHQ
jgi:Zn-dependent protease with chaperone function